MNQKDIIQRFMIENANIRGELVDLTESFQTILKQRDYSSSFKTLLGEALVAATLMTATIKFKGRLALQFQGKGPINLVLAQCTHDFKIRGLIQGDNGATEEAIQSALKEGTLGILVTQENTTARYQGIVAWEGNSLTQSVESYFKNSEQIPTKIWITVSDHKATGLLLQALPHETTLKSQPIYTDEIWEHIVHLTKTIKPEELLHLDPLTILHRLYSEEDIRLFDSQTVSFACTCSLKRGENAILMLGQKEAEFELNQKQSIVVTCEFCGKDYSFDKVDVASIFKNNPDFGQTH